MALKCSHIRPRLASLIAILGFSISIASLSSAHTAYIQNGRVGFQTPHEVVAFPEGVTELVFDTSQALHRSPSTFVQIGDLIVDSLRRDGIMVPVTSEDQIQGIDINSAEFLEALQSLHARSLRKVFPNSVMGDTLIWNPIRQRFFAAADLSTKYYVQFDTLVSVDSAISRLDEIPSLSQVQPVPQVIRFALDEDFPNDPLYGIDQWSLKDSPGIEGGCAWSRLLEMSGDSVKIAVIDEGVDWRHADLAQQWEPESDTMFRFEHGTEVASIILAATDNDTGMAAVMPFGRLLSYYVPFGDPPAMDSILNQIERARLDSAQVINMSWGILDDNSNLYDVLDRAYKQGIILVAATGNRILDTTFPYKVYPPLYNDIVIAVGAHAKAGPWKSWSNYGAPDKPLWPVPDFVDVSAPGESLAVALPLGGVNNDYSLNEVWGTSFAAPHVTGVVAMARWYDPNLPISFIRDCLSSTAVFDTMMDDAHKIGAGRVNACDFMKAIVNASAPEASMADSIPYLIITNSENGSALLRLVETKTRRGTPTEMKYVTDIASAYPGIDLPAKIRNCIKDYYENKHLEYVLLGGDGDAVPFRYAHQDIHGPGIEFVSDFYYACLDGDWNADADEYYGEVEDSVDLAPEVAVGRIPLADFAEVDDYVTKLLLYENAQPTGWQTKALFLGSELFQYGDGPELSEEIRALFPPSFTTSVLYDDETANASDTAYFQRMNSGQGLVVKYCLAQHEGNFCIRSSSALRFIHSDEIDTLRNQFMPSVIYSATCWNQRLEMDCIAKHYLKHPTGGAVAYIGSTHNDFVYCSQDVATEFFTRLFGGGPKEIGKLINLSTAVLAPKTRYDNCFRHTMLSYDLSGDPQMRIWTGLPRSMEQSHTPSVYRGQAVTILTTVTDAATGLAVAGAKVCLMKDNDEYQIETTGETGLATFHAYFTSTGIATLTASREGFVYNMDSVRVLSPPSPPPSCPVLYVHDSHDFIEENTLLTGCEESDYQNDVVDYYPIGADIRPVGNEIRFQLREMEDETTFLQDIQLITVDHDADASMFCGNDGNIFTFNTEPIPPLSALDQDGVDCLAALTSRDGVLYASESSGFIVLTFPGHSAPTGYELMSTTKTICDDPWPEKPNAGQTSGKSALVIETLGDDGVWYRVSSIPPRSEVSTGWAVSNRLIAGNSDIETIRVSWQGSYSTDAILQYLPSGELPRITTWDMTASTLIGSGTAAKSSPRFSETEPLIMHKGDILDFSFSVDTDPDQSTTRSYIIKAAGRYQPGYHESPRVLPGHYELFSNYPNPFNPSTTISFTLAKPGEVTLEIFNVAGQRVKTLINGQCAAGYRSVIWDGTNDTGDRVATGMYLYRITADEFVDTKKMILVK